MMVAQQTFGRILLAPLRLVSWGFAFYFSHITLIVLAIIPSVIRGYQMYTGYTPETLETILWIIRIALFVSIIRIGWKEREKIRFSELTVPSVVEMIVTALWQYVWFQYAIIPGIKWATELIGSETAMDSVVHLFGIASADVSALAKSVLFVLKNIFVIPMYLMFLLRIVKLI